MKVNCLQCIQNTRNTTTQLQCLSDKNGRLITSTLEKYTDISATKIYFGAISQGYRRLEPNTEDALIGLVINQASQKKKTLSDADLQ